MTTHSISAITHLPWSSDDADQQQRDQATLAAATATQAARRVNAGWFVAVALATYAFVRLGGAQHAVSFYACVIAGVGIAYLSALAAARLRNAEWLLEDWKMRVGHALLTSADVVDLQSRARPCETANTLLVRWIAAGHRLRERDRRAIEEILADAGIASPQRPASMSELLLESAA